MNRPRLDLGLEASRATLHQGECARVGGLLRDGRARRAFTIDDVAKRLLLAPAQVVALERGSADAFYSAEFYAAASRKYATLVGVDAADLSRILVQPQDPGAPPVFRRGRRGAMVESIFKAPRPSARVMVGVGVVVTTMAAGLLIAAVWERSGRRDRDSSAGPVETPSLEPAAPAPAPAPPAPAPSRAPEPLDAASHPDGLDMVPAVAAEPAGSVGRVRVGQRTWVFVRYASGTTLERVLGGGEELVLKDVPIYIAVGSAEAASIEIAGQALDTSLFTVNGQLRVGSSPLARLTSLH
jgi:hypothetical protein